MLCGAEESTRALPGAALAEGVQSTEALSWQKAEGWDKHRG